MQDSKLIKMFKALSTEECKYLRWFTQSNFFNTDPNLLLLYEALAKHFPDFNSKTLTKEAIFGKVFTGQAFNDGKWRNLCSKMTKLLEDYLVTLEWKKNKQLKEKLLIGAFEQRNIDFDEFKKKSVGLIKELDSLPFRDEEYFFSKMEMQRKLYNQSSTVGEVEIESLVLEAMENLDEYYYLARIKLINEIQNRKAVRHSSADENKLPKIPSENKLFQIYSRINKMNNENDNNIYYEIRGDFIGDLVRIKSNEKEVIIKFLLNFAIKQVRVDASIFLREVFELYKIAHEQNLLATNGVVTNTTFINLVNSAARVAEFEWAEKFILENLEKIEGKTRNEIEKLGRGFLSFNKNEFSNVVDMLSTLTFSEILYQLLAKSLSLQAYFELFLADPSYFSFIKNYSQSFEKYVSRNPGIGKKKSNSYMIYIRLVRRLAGLIYHGELTVEKRKTLLKDLNSKTEIAERNWLKSKIEGK